MTIHEKKKYAQFAPIIEENLFIKLMKKAIKEGIFSKRVLQEIKGAL